MTLSEIRQKYLDFFKSKDHVIIPSASIVPENDPTVLFTTAGMQPLVPFLVGTPHPSGKRLTDAQVCLRTDDIDEVGDNRHLTMFEMLGNWSLGDYFKEESIGYSFEFLTSDKGLALDPKRIYVTVFEGDADAPRDEESIALWQKAFASAGITAEVGVSEKDEPTKTEQGARIYAYPKKKNWWGPAGLTGPCGPDTEIFYDTGLPHTKGFDDVCNPNCDCGRFVEIWNNVFMQYNKTADGTFVPLAQKNVDTGMGLERITTIKQGSSTVFDIEVFQSIFDAIKVLAEKTPQEAERSYRIIADHIRAATFVIGDQNGVAPSNVGQGYIVRRLLRRAIREGKRIGINEMFTAKIADEVIRLFGDHYTQLTNNRERIIEEMNKEEEKFGRTIENGMKELEKMMAKGEVSGEQAFLLYQSFGFPIELTEELLQENGKQVDKEAFAAEFKKHQDLSRTASAGAFKGGLADHSEETTRLHTATHLLHKALKVVLGDHVEQKGSNITAERLRFDFSHPQKMTDEEKQRVEDMVNDAIRRDLPVTSGAYTTDEARDMGALGYFADKYAQLGGNVTVYTVGDYSKEICGGPHVAHTGELGSFKLVKEEAVSAGVRRIKATVTGPQK
ncbi:MAG TPA: alanine--tRNA ligase [bacterium]|nr:alanine--tRNA ligase [bacterium]